MSKYYYTKGSRKRVRFKMRYLGLGLSILGLGILLYFGLPVLTSYAVLQQVYASQTMTSPIPQTTVLTGKRIQNILAATINSVQQIDYTNAKTWFPSLEINPATPRVKAYSLTIPKLGISDASVSTVDYNVGQHLVNYGGTAVPPDRGNAVVFGHSTLPQLFNQNDYKTIFANLHKLEKNDLISVTVDGTAYQYRVFAISIVSPDDFGPLTQEYDSSYLTLITCTPPGTTFERLVVKSKLITVNAL